MDDNNHLNDDENNENVEDVTIATEAEKPQDSEKPPCFELFDWLRMVVVPLSLIVLVFTFFVRVIGVNGPSMIPTLNHADRNHEDRIVISRLFYTPKRGDIVVLRKESFMADPIVKRIIAVGGDTIDIDFGTGEVTLNGTVLDEPYIADSTHLRYDKQFPLTVPEGHVFVMGDNREQSLDSRSSRLDVVDTRYIIGKVLFRIYPLNMIGVPK